MATGGVKVNDEKSSTMRTVVAISKKVNEPMDAKGAAERMYEQRVLGAMVPQRIMSDLIGGGVPERFPDLHFGLIEFNAHWLMSLLGAMDKSWVVGIGKDDEWWLGMWDPDLLPTVAAQSSMARLFLLNNKWLYP